MTRCIPDLPDVLQRVALLRQELTDEQSRLERALREGEYIDLGWYSSFVAITVHLLGCEAVLSSMIDHDEWTGEEVDT